MGNSSSIFLTATELEEYSELLYLSKPEIIQIYNRLKRTVPSFSSSIRIEVLVFKQVFPEFANNPFLQRIVHVFSSQQDERFSFEDILDIYSALSPNCPSSVKARWAFRIFDFDGDGQIDQNDITRILESLTDKVKITGYGLNQTDKDHIAKSILEDLDLDETGGVTAAEFEHAVVKMPEFSQAFKLKP